MNSHSPMVIHYVHDMDRAYAFYHDTLGLEADTRSSGWSTLKCAGLLVALHTLPADGGEGTMRHAGLNLEVDDLDAAVREVEAGGGKIRKVRNAGGGAPVRLAEITDTEGNNFELRQFVGK